MQRTNKKDRELRPSPVVVRCGLVQALVEQLLGGLRRFDAREGAIGDALAHTLLHHGVLHRGFDGSERAVTDLAARVQLALEPELRRAAQDDAAFAFGGRTTAPGQAEAAQAQTAQAERTSEAAVEHTTESIALRAGKDAAGRRAADPAGGRGARTKETGCGAVQFHVPRTFADRGGVHKSAV